MLSASRGICNPSPINELGFYGTGLPISSNPVNITTPGTTSDYVWFAAPGESQYFVPIELLTGTVGSTVRLPYVPNSMVMDQARQQSLLRLGARVDDLQHHHQLSHQAGPQRSRRGAGGFAQQSQLLINDQARQLFYLYNTARRRLYHLWRHGQRGRLDSGLARPSTSPITRRSTTCLARLPGTRTRCTSTTRIPAGAPIRCRPARCHLVRFRRLREPPNVAVSCTMQTPALTIPSEGAYLRGTPTVAHAWCPTGTVTSAGSSITSFYPGPYPGTVATQGGDSQPVQSDVLTATTDGKHILGAGNGGRRNYALRYCRDSPHRTACPSYHYGLRLQRRYRPSSAGHRHPASAYNQAAIQAMNATTVDQVVASPVSNLAFITYNGSTSGAQLPYYLPGAGGSAGTLGYVTLERPACRASPTSAGRRLQPPTIPSSLSPRRATT